MQYAYLRAASASVIFAAAGILGFFYFPQGQESTLLEAYFAVLLLNTFFSIRTFTPLTPQSAAQTVFDGVLALLYVALACSFGSIEYFCAFSFALFAVAIGKYAHLMTLIDRKRFLRRKMLINGLAVLLSAATFVMAAVGFPALAAWVLFVCFALANIYFLGINPMYRIK
jgi:hypothetical protein